MPIAQLLQVKPDAAVAVLVAVMVPPVPVAVMVPPVPVAVMVPPVPVAVTVPPVPVVDAVTLPPVPVVALPLPLLEDVAPLPALIVIVVPEGRPNEWFVIDVADYEPAPPRAPGPLAIVPPAVVVVARHGWGGC